MRARAQEQKVATRRGGRAGEADGESDVLAEIADRPEADRRAAKRRTPACPGAHRAASVVAYGRQGSLRRLGQGGNAAGALTPGTTGRLRLEGIVLEKATDSVAVPLGG